MKVRLELPAGVRSISPRDVECGELFIGEPLTADGLSDITVSFHGATGPPQRYTALAYKIAKKNNKYYPCIIPFTQTRRRLSARRAKSARPTRRLR